jgi:hypothetical protein
MWAAEAARRMDARSLTGSMCRDGERCVGQCLERLRDGSGQVFHDLPSEGFNLDHVVISPHGLYVVETKTVSRPSPKATITVEGDSLRVAGRIPDRNSIEQVTAAARQLPAAAHAARQVQSQHIFDFLHCKPRLCHPFAPFREKRTKDDG